MNCELVAPVLYLDINERGFSFGHNVTLYKKGSGEIDSIFRFNNSLLTAIGTHAVDKLYENTNFHWASTFEKLQELYPFKNSFELGHVMTSTLMFDVMCLWFEKDNSCFCDHGYLLTNGRTTASIDNRDVFVSRSDGTYSTEVFSTQEFMRANEIAQLLQELIGNFNPSDALNRTTDGSGYVLAGDHSHFKSNRINRAFMMLMVARSTVELAMKIAFYMNSLECLFTTDDTEVSNKVAQRVALFVGGSADQMKETRNWIKNGYNVRSKFFHGAGSTKKSFEKESLAIISTEIDIVLRTVLLKVIKEESSKFLSEPDVLNSYFDSFVYRDA